jgi:glycosyltransferase involved in cell wall biosynthesis
MSSPGPLVTVVVPTLNRPDGLGPALSSITVQEGLEPADIEVIVVNDGGVPPRSRRGRR